MIYIRQIRNTNGSGSGEIWAIVRSLKNTSPSIIQVPDLSPSWNLFKNYLNAKNAGMFNEDWFKKVYVPTFLSEIKGNIGAKARLNELYIRSKRGESITLCCFCSDEALCHRSIVAGLLQGVGTEVNCQADYSHYYDEYKLL